MSLMVVLVPTFSSQYSSWMFKCLTAKMPEKSKLVCPFKVCLCFHQYGKRALNSRINETRKCMGRLGGGGAGVEKKSETVLPRLFFCFCCRVVNVPERVLYIHSSFIWFTRSGSHDMLIKVH